MCDVARCELDVELLEVELDDEVVAAVADELSSSDSCSPDEVADDEELDLVALAAVWVVAAWPSCQASTPPSDSIVATLSAAAALRARAAFGLRRGGRAPAEVGTTGAVAGSVGSSMDLKVRTVGERSSRAG